MIDQLANALDAMGCPNPRSVAVLTLEVLPQVLDQPATVTELHRPGLLTEAEMLVNGDRQEAYGEPVECMEKWAAVLRVLYGWDIDAHRASIAMSLLKHVRESHKPDRSNRVDGAGYLEIADRAAP